jgi:hypothetical protein
MIDAIKDNDFLLTRVLITQFGANIRYVDSISNATALHWGSFSIFFSKFASSSFSDSILTLCPISSSRFYSGLSQESQVGSIASVVGWRCTGCCGCAGERANH